VTADSWHVGSNVPGPREQPKRPSGDPTSLGRFLLRGELGRGGMGVVYRAFDPKLDREVALKVVRPDRLESTASSTRLLREADAMASLRHPGIVALHEVGRVGQHSFLVCELVEDACTLEVAFSTRTWPERLELVLQVADALGFAHSRGLVHRDVKPANVLVDRSGRTRLIDLGLVTGADLERLTRTGAMVGTPTTMAPEQIAGSRDRVGPPADVWALGVLLYLALTEELPFVAGDMIELASAITRRDPVPPRTLTPDVPPALEACCLKALHKDYQRRPPDGAAFATELRQALERSPSSSSYLPAFLLAGALTVLTLGGAALYASRKDDAPVASLGPQPTPSPSSTTPTPSPSPTATPPAKSPLVTRAQELTRAGRRLEALRLLDAELEESPHDVELLTTRALIRQGAGQGMGAREDVDLALQLDPEHAQAYRIRGVLRIPLGDYPGALADVEQAMRLDPSDRVAARNHAAILSAMNRLEEAVAEFDELLEKHPNDPDVLMARAVAWEFSGDWQKSLDDVDAAIKASDQVVAKHHYSRARALRQLGRTKDALAAHDAALELEPTYGDVFIERTLIWLALRQVDRAEQDARRGVELLPKKGAAWAHLGHVLALKGDLPGCALAYEQGLELNPNMAPAWSNLGGVRLRQKNYPKAIHALTRSVELTHSATSFLNRGRAYLSAEEWKSGFSDLKHALRHTEATSPTAQEARRLLEIARTKLGSAADDIPDPHPEEPAPTKTR
jgi:eukaryotic-like serine/threonine-protein kinase